MNIHGRDDDAPAMDPIRTLLLGGLHGVPRPLFPGAVALVSRNGVSDPAIVVGDALRYTDSTGTELPISERVAMRADTVFDIASLTKLFTATVLLGLVEEGLIALDTPIADRLPTFGGGDRRSVTLRHLLSHTSGLPALLRLWTDHPDVTLRWEAVLGAGLEGTPGQTFVYSDVGYLVAGFLAEIVGGRPLPELVAESICAPLGLVDTGFLPGPERAARAAATEDEHYVGRGIVRGFVHDENSWSLGGAVGHAGLFSTAHDLMRFGDAIRRGRTLGGARILREATVEEMLCDQLQADVDPGFRQGLGFRLADPTFMGVLAASGAVGHTGFTGTSLVIDRSRGLVVVLLTNRVHPSRDWSDIAVIRRRTAELAAGAGATGGALG
ncbi:MAG TPA: serine hydrolase domain-containing protein [Patescibacteria group bacterium]|nr:serine hydrolase domain-containing protein [Patescibacteria group bacterium]